MKSILHNSVTIQLKDATVKQLNDSKAWYIATIAKWEARDTTPQGNLLIIRYRKNLDSVRAEIGNRIGK